MEDRSKSQRKRDMLALQALGERLVELPAAQLARVPVPDDLLDAVHAARAIASRSARKRQLQYIGRLMREVDAEPIREALARIDGAGNAERVALHRAERWRERLLDEGDTALSEFLDEFPTADRPHLRRLVREAAAERAAGSAPRRQRELFRTVRTLLDG